MAEAAVAGCAPVLLWGTTEAHICLGQSQNPGLELVPQPAAPVVRRPLGGGTVWVDEHQWCHVLVLPLRLAPRRVAQWCNWALQPAVATCRHFGLVVELHDGDLWLQGRKIAGSGSATIGNCAVIASSFLMKFPVEKFARCIAGSENFRDWLVQGLEQTMTDWSSHVSIPTGGELREVHAAEVENSFGWKFHPSALTQTESAAMTDALVDEWDDDHPGCRARAGGIKLNAESWLVERWLDGVSVRELVVRGEVARREIIGA